MAENQNKMSSHRPFPFFCYVLSFNGTLPVGFSLFLFILSFLNSCNLEWVKVYKDFQRWKTGSFCANLHYVRYFIFTREQHLYTSLCLPAGRSTKVPHSLAAAVFLPGGWNLQLRSSMCIYVKVYVCVYANRLKGAWQWEWPIAKKCITSKWIHRLAQDLV